MYVHTVTFAHARTHTRTPHLLFDQVNAVPVRLLLQHVGGDEAMELLTAVVDAELIKRVVLAAPVCARGRGTCVGKRSPCGSPPY